MRTLDDVYVRFVKTGREEEDARGIQAVDDALYLAQERKGFSRPHVAKALPQQLEKNKRMAMVAADANNNIVGYALYMPLKDGVIELLKLEIMPDCEGAGLREALVAAMHEKLKPSTAQRLVAHVHVDDVALQKALAEVGYKADKGAAILKNYFPGGGAAVRLQAVLPEVKLEAASEKKPQNRKELLLAMLGHLEGMTGRMWEAAMPDAAGVLQSVDVTHMNCDHAELRLRTREAVVNVGEATAAVTKYLGATVPPGMARLNKAGQVVVKAEHVRASALRAGMEGAFSQLFTISEGAVKSTDNPPGAGHGPRG